MERGKPNGITSTKADYWIYRIHLKNETIDYLMKTNDLGLLCCDTDWKTSMGGNGGKAKMFLIPVEDFLKICKKIS